MNIAPKSVEIARYRLRKKLHLDPGTSLNQFINIYKSPKPQKNEKNETQCPCLMALFVLFGAHFASAQQNDTVRYNQYG